MKAEFYWVANTIIGDPTGEHTADSVDGVNYLSMSVARNTAHQEGGIHGFVSMYRLEVEDGNGQRLSTWLLDMDVNGCITDCSLQMEGTANAKVPN